MPRSSDSEHQFVSSRRGKWSELNVPHKGWHCVDIEDVGDSLETCEMCESSQVRYVHIMENDRYDGALRTGCVCAGHMEGDLIAAQSREKKIRSRAGKRNRWLSRDWKTSAKGNPKIKADGYIVTIWNKDGRFGHTLIEEGGDSVRHSRRRYATEHEAKLAAFDSLTLLVNRNRGQSALSPSFVDFNGLPIFAGPARRPNCFSIAARNRRFPYAC